MSERADRCLRDGFGRRVEYLRLSVINRCNFRCFYCRPQGDKASTSGGTLAIDQIERLAELFLRLGVKRIRLTGGEPLLRNDIVEVAQALSALPGLAELTLSTNGFRLAQLAEPLYRAGVSRVNVSIDSLTPQTFRAITRSDCHAEVMAGIRRAVAVGMRPVKINVVALRGINDHEIIEMVRLAAQWGLDLRFIEAMPIGTAGAASMRHQLPAEEILRRMRAGLGTALIPETGHVGGGPARYYRLGALGGSVGVISAVSRHFCASCNRVRIAANGDLLTCLGHAGSAPLGALLQAGASDADLTAAILEALRNKPWGHQFDPSIAAGDRAMDRIGG